MKAKLNVSLFTTLAHPTHLYDAIAAWNSCK